MFEIFLWLVVIAIIILGGFIYLLVISKGAALDDSEIYQKYGKKIDGRYETIRDFELQGSPYEFKDNLNFIIFDKKKEKVLLAKGILDDKAGVIYEHYLINFEDIISTEVMVNEESVSKTMRGQQLGGAIVGGVLLGGVGAIIGGLSGGKKEEKKLHDMVLKVVVNDLDNPIIEIDLLDNKKGSDEYKFMIRKKILDPRVEEDKIELDEIMDKVARCQSSFDVIINNQSA